MAPAGLIQHLLQFFEFLVRHAEPVLGLWELLADDFIVVVLQTV